MQCVFFYVINQQSLPHPVLIYVSRLCCHSLFTQILHSEPRGQLGIRRSDFHISIPLLIFFFFFLQETPWVYSSSLNLIPSPSWIFQPHSFMSFPLRLHSTPSLHHPFLLGNFLATLLLSLWNCCVYPTTASTQSLGRGTASPSLASLTLHLVGSRWGIWVIIYFSPFTQYVPRQGCYI